MYLLPFYISILSIIGCSFADVFHCTNKGSLAVSSDDPHFQSKPNVNGVKMFYGGIIDEYTGAYQPVTSPIIDASTGQRTVIGSIAQMKKDDIPAILNAAKAAWNNGQGVWPQMSAEERISAIQNVVKGLKEKRAEIVNVLMWEICKSATDAALEFDRTIQFIESLIETYREINTQDGSWQTVSGIFAKIRRTAIGLVLVLGPFNYPFNETYATLIPALLLGNVVIMKIPTTGGLVHMLTMDIYARALPAGVMNFLSGAGRELVSPLMATGAIDVLAFIGGSKAADTLIKAHPHPHRLVSFLQLEGKNLGIVLPDAEINDAMLDQMVLGTTSFNGQRCTAIKLIFVHTSQVAAFLPALVAKIASLSFGLPWSSNGKVSITPLPEMKKVISMESLLSDALMHGGKIYTPESIESKEVKAGECEVYDNLMRPTIVYPVTKEMRLYSEEQFGPIIPIVSYTDEAEILSYFEDTVYGQQVALFTTQASNRTIALVDALSTLVGRININTQCGRSPDSFPFSGRKSSALGTMSISQALKTFSIETVFAGKQAGKTVEIMQEIGAGSHFLAPMNKKPVAAVCGELENGDAKQQCEGTATAAAVKV